MAVKRKKIVGVIGGLGPEATLDFFGKILEATTADKDQDHLHLIIDNNPRAVERAQAHEPHILFGNATRPTLLSRLGVH